MLAGVLATAALAALAVGFGAAAADAPAVPPAGSAAGFALQVRIPGAAVVTQAPAVTHGGSATAGGGFATQPDTSIASVLDSATDVSVTANGTAARGDATTRIAGVTLLDGLVTARSVTAQAAALAATTTPATGGLLSNVDGLVVDGKPVAATPNRVVLIPGVGDLVVEESVDAVRGPQAHRSFAVALHLRLRSTYRGLPAGTEILVGYADAGASVPDPTANDVGPAAAPDPAAATTTPAATPAPVVVPPSTFSGDPESPPPGGFTNTPPITQEHVDQLLDGTYMFPVLGATANDFSNDFGAFRADTGFHQGIDIFAPMGTPILAINDGVVSNVGWNRLGGRRFWFTDRYGNGYYFAHLSGFSPLAREGAQVHRGDVLGFVGDSGDAQGTSPHLHFEMHPGNGWAVPPFQYVTSWLTGVRQPVSAVPMTTAPDPANPDATTPPKHRPKPKPKPKPIAPPVETLPVLPTTSSTVGTTTAQPTTAATAGTGTAFSG